MTFDCLEEICSLYSQETPDASQREDELQQLIFQTAALLLPAGYSEKSIQRYTVNGFAPISNYFNQRGVCHYSEALLDNFINEKRDAYDQKLISRYIYQNARKAAMLLKEFHDTGTIQWHYIPAWNTKTLTINFAHAVQSYCETNSQNRTLAPGTIATSKSAIRQFLFCAEELGIYDLPKLTRSIVNSCITILAPRYPCGMKSCIPAIRSFLTFAFDTGLITEPLQTAIPETAAPRRVIRHGFSLEEQDTLLCAPDRSTIVGKRDYAMMLLAVQTGLRVVDISNLAFRNIDWHESVLKLVQHKTGQPLSLPMESVVGNALADYILNGRPECDCSYVFLTKDLPYRKLHNRSASSIVSRYIQKFEIDRETILRRGFHSFRRSFGARMLQSEVPLEMLSELLGHTSINSSKPYIAIDVEGLRNCAIGLSGIEVRAGELQW